MSRTARTARITRTPRTRRLAAAVAVALAVTGGALTAPAVAAAPTAVTAPADAQPPVPLIKDGGNLASAGPSGFLTLYPGNDTISSLWTRYADGSTVTLPGTESHLPTGRTDLLTQVDNRVLTIRDMGRDAEPVVMNLDHLEPGYQTGRAVGPSSAVTVWTDPEGGEELHLVTRTATGLRAEKISGVPEAANITSVVVDSPGTVLVRYVDPADTTVAAHLAVVDVERRAVVEDVTPAHTTGDVAVSPTHLAWIETPADSAATVVVMPRGGTPDEALRIPLENATRLQVALLDGWVLYGKPGADVAGAPNPLYALTARSLTDARTVKVLDTFTRDAPGPDGTVLAQGGTLDRGEGVYRIGIDPDSGVPAATQVATTGRPTVLTLLSHDVPDVIDFDRQTSVKLAWYLSHNYPRTEVKLTHTATGRSGVWIPTTRAGGRYVTWDGRFSDDVVSPDHAPVPNGAYTWHLTAWPGSGIGPVLEQSGGFTVQRAPVAHDYDDNGVPDLVERTVGDRLVTHAPVDPIDRWRGNEAAPMVLGSGGWNVYDRIVTTGNLAGAPNSDLVARDRDGVLWLYQGTGRGLTRRVQVGGGWQAYDKITSAADLTGDGRTDLLAADKAGVLWLYKGTGSASAPFAKRVQVGGGWQMYNDIAAVGNVAGAAAGDLVARDKAGVLWLYLGKGDGTFTARTRVGGGWQTYHHVTGFGDLDRDGYADLIGVKGPHESYLYLGTGQRTTPFAARKEFRSYSEPTSPNLY
ncbi:FG-GAP repeat domain-containing protein [Streptomyces sp. NPDC014773]|uniref:FG-GAP repeat domain-containing protein n=1 Tax=Streptomyces sp. NPDC014773 TaxID=3364908 RepID=UPI0036FF1735